MLPSMSMRLAFSCAALLLPSWALGQTLGSARVDGDGIRLEFDERMRSRVVATFAGETPLGPFEESETLLTASGALGDFALEGREESAVNDALGDGRRVTLIGHAGRIAKRVEVTAYDGRPRWLFVRVRYTNEGDAPVEVLGWTSHRYVFDAGARGRGAGLLVVPERLLREAARLGAAPPARLHAAELPGHERLGLRRRHAGRRRVAARRRPRGRPRRARSEARVAARAAAPGRQRRAGGRARSAPTTPRSRARASTRCAPSWPCTAAITSRRCARTARRCRPRASASRSAPKDAFEPIWCAWGYGRDFTPQQVFETLPVAKRLGFRWAVLDDGWQVAEGDWVPGRDQVPRRRRRHEGARGPHPRGRPQGAALVDAARRRSRLAHRPRASRLAAAQRGRLAAQDHLVGLVLPLPRPRSGARRRRRLRAKGARRVGLRRPQDRRPAPERRAALLQPGARPRGAGGRGRRRAGLLQGDLGRGAGHQARRARRDLPLRHRLLVLHDALPQHGGRLRSGELLAGAAQGQDAEGARRRPRRLLRRPRGDERGRHRLRLHLRRRRRHRHQLRLARRAGQEGRRSSC